VTLEGLSSSYFFSRNSLKCFATASAIEIVHPEQAEVPLTGSGLVAFASLDSPASTSEISLCREANYTALPPTTCGESGLTIRSSLLH